MKADIGKVIDAFWTDTYYVDQNACSSPRLVAWTGSERGKAREKFWSALHDKVEREYDVTAILAVNKLASFTRLSMLSDGVKLESGDSYLYRVMVDAPSPDIMRYKDGGGYFFECCFDDLEELVPLMDDKACQTVALFGIPTKSVRDLVFEKGIKGVDRIVSLGKTTAPGFDWDGYTLIDSLSRFVEVEESCY